MGKGLLLLLAGFALGLSAAIFFRSTPDQRRVELDALPQPYYTVLWENEDVRIVEHRLEAGAREPMHSHPRMVGYFLETSTVRITESNGTVADTVLTKGTIGVVGPWTHEIENTGSTPLHSLIVEFKSGAK
jgi:hypothetical protein